jgi:hypothetical protein
MAPVKPVPVIVTESPPLVRPVFGLTPVTVGATVVYVNWSEEPRADTPPNVVTTTSTVPAT